MTNATKATKAELHMYRNWKAQLQLELKNRVKAANNKLIEESKKALAQLEENFKDINVGQDNRSFFYHNNGKTYHYPTRFTSDSEADRKCRIKYQGLFVQHYEMFSLLSESKDEEWLELQARYYSAREPHFTGFDGDGYRNPAENK
tara:strand:+ start:49 stop:486 length:438 start_codon:yes stop_codon:yes gene_type:complete